MALRQVADHCVCHLRVPLMDHLQAVRPPGPMCWHTRPQGALQPTSAANWLRRGLLQTQPLQYVARVFAQKRKRNHALCKS